jgi:hypothetical protein
MICNVSIVENLKGITFMFKHTLTLLMYTVIFFLVPLVGALGPLGYVATKHFDRYQKFIVENPRLGPFTVYLYLILQFTLSCVILTLTK